MAGNGLIWMELLEMAGTGDYDNNDNDGDDYEESYDSLTVSCVNACLEGA